MIWRYFVLFLKRRRIKYQTGSVMVETSQAAMPIFHYLSQPWKMPQTPLQEFVKEFLAFGGWKGPSLRHFVEVSWQNHWSLLAKIHNPHRKVTILRSGLLMINFNRTKTVQVLLMWFLRINKICSQWRFFGFEYFTFTAKNWGRSGKIPMMGSLNFGGSTTTKIQIWDLVNFVNCPKCTGC